MILPELSETSGFPCSHQLPADFKVCVCVCMFEEAIIDIGDSWALKCSLQPAQSAWGESRYEHLQTVLASCVSLLIMSPSV